jgi:hypothetical protein
LETILKYVLAAPLAEVLTTPRGTRNLSTPKNQKLLSLPPLLDVLMVSFTSQKFS